MAMFDTVRDKSSHGGLCGGLTRFVLRFFQFVLALTVAGMYGVDLHHGNQAGVKPDAKWVYAEVVAGLSAFTTIVYFIPFIKSYWFFAWDFILFVLWTAVFGIFGRIYIPAHHVSPKQTGVIRMKHAVWVDLASMLLWFITAVYSTAIWWRNRGERSMHTGRAKV